MDSTSLSITSYNSQGSGSSRLHVVMELSRVHDIILLQEHWLHSSQMHILERNTPDMYVHGISAINDTDVLVGRPYGGVACLWRKSLKCKVTPIETNSNRLCAIKCEFDDTAILIISVYMPCDSKIYDSDNANLFRDSIVCIRDLCINAGTDNIIIGVDWNIDLSRVDSVNRQYAESFIDDE